MFWSDSSSFVWYGQCPFICWFSKNSQTQSTTTVTESCERAMDRTNIMFIPVKQENVLVHAELPKYETICECQSLLMLSSFISLFAIIQVHFINLFYPEWSTVELFKITFYRDVFTKSAPYSRCNLLNGRKCYREPVFHDNKHLLKHTGRLNWDKVATYFRQSLWRLKQNCSQHFQPFCISLQWKIGQCTFSVMSLRSFTTP